MIINAIAVDDEFPSNEIIKRYCLKVDCIDLKNTFTDETAALQYLSTHKIDLLFIDIDMPDISGIEFVKMISKEMLVVFISAYSESSLKHASLDVFAYLTKPVSMPRFISVLEKAKPYFNSKTVNNE